ncbi:hypothetical protein PAT3040_00453 [Paenibacillus agaridevorans]|uniref:ABC transporter substrate-binding protein n=1 Tax=Paenibacillus agaridevorans TaxID=171404 RepID=A0A2R5EIQ8_9BACL|nr:extracellular solute-binding protein [Paenibacillus agaridevorans]GBG05965.1 hypothetical protein PAT3040_00453 [Paenibacillus agaridevorans]
MRMNKSGPNYRNGVWITALLILLVILASCKQESTEQGNTGMELVEPVTIRVWGGTPAQSGPNEVIANWRKVNPHVNIEYVQFENNESGNEKLETAIYSGREIDVVIGYDPQLLNKRILSGMLEPLNSYLSKDGINLTKEFQAEIHEHNGSVYYIPASRSVEGILINKDMLDALGESVPSADWTWKDFVDLAERLTTGEGENKVYGVASNGELTKMMAHSYFGANCCYNDKGESNFGHPIWTEILRLQSRMHNEDRSIYPIEEQLHTRMSPDQQFLSGKAAMVWGVYLIRSVQNPGLNAKPITATVAPTPRMSQDSPGYNGFGSMDYVSINAKSKHKQEAWEFLKWYVREGFGAMSDHGRFPLWNGVNADKIIENYFSKASDRFDTATFQQFYSRKYQFYFPDVQQSVRKDMKDILSEEVKKMLFAEQSLEDTLSVLKKRASEAASNP